MGDEVVEHGAEVCPNMMGTGLWVKVLGASSLEVASASDLHSGAGKLRPAVHSPQELNVNGSVF